MGSSTKQGRTSAVLLVLQNVWELIAASPDPRWSDADVYEQLSGRSILLSWSSSCSTLAAMSSWCLSRLLTLRVI